MVAAIPTELYTQLQRKIAWDSLPCDEVRRYMPVLDLVPPSPEGEEIEHQESHRRLGLQQPLQTHLAVTSVMAARALAALALRLPDGPEPAEIVTMVNTQFAQTIHVGVSVIVANLLDEGYLQLGPKAMEL